MFTQPRPNSPQTHVEPTLTVGSSISVFAARVAQGIEHLPPNYEPTSVVLPHETAGQGRP